MDIHLKNIGGIHAIILKVNYKIDKTIYGFIIY
ncbi:hypothetical protein IWX83_002965 [Flavobacterium sp. CG_9.1]|nr:hypothetical protein [Flavobacterium sp. CG_9.1]